MPDSDECAPDYALEHLADVLAVSREAIPPHAGPLPLPLTSPEAVDFLRTTHRTVLEECRRGSFPAIKIGGDSKVWHLFILAAAVGIILPRPIPYDSIKTDIKDYRGRDLDQESDISH